MSSNILNKLRRENSETLEFVMRRILVALSEERSLRGDMYQDSTGLKGVKYSLERTLSELIKYDKYEGRRGDL